MGRWGTWREWRGCWEWADGPKVESATACFAAHPLPDERLGLQAGGEQASLLLARTLTRTREHEDNVMKVREAVTAARKASSYWKPIPPDGAVADATSDSDFAGLSQGSDCHSRPIPRDWLRQKAHKYGD